MPEVADELLVRPESHRAQRRMQPVGSDHQLETPPVTAVEDHLDPVRVLRELGDPVAEDIFDIVTSVLVEHLRQVTAQDLDLRDESVAAVVVHAEGLQHVPGRIHGVCADGLGAGRAYRRVQPHPPDDFLGHSTRVHGLATGTQFGGPLHHGRHSSPPVQPVGQRGSCNAGSRHQHSRTAHCASHSPRRITVRIDCFWSDLPLSACPEVSTADPPGIHRCSRSRVRVPANTSNSATGHSDPHAEPLVRRYAYGRPGQSAKVARSPQQSGMPIWQQGCGTEL